MLKNCIFRAIKEAKIWRKCLKNCTPYRGFMVIKNTEISKYLTQSLVSVWDMAVPEKLD